jgi:hypothetical protein
VRLNRFKQEAISSFESIKLLPYTILQAPLKTIYKLLSGVSNEILRITGVSIDRHQERLKLLMA